MNLTTQEKDKVLFRMAAAVLRCPSERGVRLNHPTVVAPINDLLLDDRLMVSVRQAWWMGMRLTTWLRSSHAGIVEMIHDLLMSKMFARGTKFAMGHEPIQ